MDELEKLQDKIDDLEDENKKLEAKVDRLESENSDLQDEKDELEDSVRELSPYEDLGQKMTSVFEEYRNIWPDDTKDSQLIEGLRALYYEIK